MPPSGDSYVAPLVRGSPSYGPTSVAGMPSLLRSATHPRPHRPATREAASPLPYRSVREPPALGPAAACPELGHASPACRAVAAPADSVPPMACPPAPCAAQPPL